MSLSIRHEVCGKWILAGEHSVLRGHPALVFPVLTRRMRSQFVKSDLAFELNVIGQQSDILKMIFWGVLENALNKVNKTRDDLKGCLTMENELTIGSGLGASAALCVSLGRLWHSFGWISEKNIYEFAKELENVFHGESSGVDIAVAISGEGLKFQKGKANIPFKTEWNPHWFLSHSGPKGVTAECVKKVQTLWVENPVKAESIDNLMLEAVCLAERALVNTSSEGFEQLAKAIDLGEECFLKWNLIEGELRSHIIELKKLGARSVKPTGSGGGGYVLSLWEERPSPMMIDQMAMIPLSKTT